MKYDISGTYRGVYKLFYKIYFKLQKFLARKAFLQSSAPRNTEQQYPALHISNQKTSFNTAPSPAGGTLSFLSTTGFRNFHLHANLNFISCKFTLQKKQH